MNKKTLHDICTWKEESVCVECGLKGELGCRLNPGDFWFFVFNQIPGLVMSFFGLALVWFLTGAWWPTILFAVVCIALWGLGIETRILCSHCPYWAEDSRTLHCWALTGSPKIWRYRPEPMNRLEKTVLMIFFSFLWVFPVLVEAYGIWVMSVAFAEFGIYALLGMIGVTLATILVGLQFYYIMVSRFCSRCVNLSCPMNRVPKSMVDAYLEKNPVMKRAWEKSGYKLG